MSLNEQLRERFPVLEQPQYTALIGGIEAGPYVVFGVVFNRFIVDLAGGSDLQSKRNAAAFLEEMATAPDGRVLDLLESEVLPTLLKSQGTVDAYWSLLGSATRRLLRLAAPRIAPDVALPFSE
jgi:hypothetical protein